MRTALPDGGYYMRHSNGDEFWYNREGEYHREGGPAVYSRDGKIEYYYHHGHLHRLDGPAIINHDGIQYRVNGEIPKTILDIVITDQNFDFETFPSAKIVENFYSILGLSAYRITDPDELVLAILRYS